MFIRSQKLALTRRSGRSSPSGANWYNEIFDVTSDVVTDRRLSLLIAPISGSESIMLNGLVLYNQGTWDYILSGNEIIFTNDLELTAGDTVRAKYQA